VRDRDLFLSFYEKGTFQSPVLASDRDVGGAQDHTDPVIAPHPEGGAYIAWSCDHPECFMRAFGRDRIFGHTLGRRVGTIEDHPIEPLSPVGSTRVRYPEVCPSLCLDPDGVLWALWDSTTRRESPSHRILASRLGEDGKWSPPGTVAEGEFVICPRLFNLGPDAMAVWEKLTPRGPKIHWTAVKGGQSARELCLGRQPFIASWKKGAALALVRDGKADSDVYVSVREFKK
jgi:hypothetical protein